MRSLKRWVRRLRLLRRVSNYVRYLEWRMDTWRGRFFREQLERLRERDEADKKLAEVRAELRRAWKTVHSQRARLAQSEADHVGQAEGAGDAG